MDKFPKYAQMNNKYAPKHHASFSIFEHPKYVQMFQKVYLNQVNYAKKT